MDSFEFPRLEAIDSVLIKIGVDPKTRYDSVTQDHEYTTCRLEELKDYLELYEKPETTGHEKRVLGCYFLECLNEYVMSSGDGHPWQARVFRLMHQDIHIHASELAYWSNTSEPNPEHWWPITAHLLSWQNTYG